MKYLKSANHLESFVKNTYKLIEEGYYDRRIKGEVPNFLAVVQREDFSLISELKVKSPDKPDPFFSRVESFRRIRIMGSIATAVSILTEPTYFGGNLDYLEFAANLKIPILMKDFIVDEAQLKVPPKGAGVLLIARLYPDDKLMNLIEAAKKRDLVPVVEIDNGTDFKRIEQFNVEIIGINNRNLETLTLRKGFAENIIEENKGTKIVFGFSGYESLPEILLAVQKGLDGVLVGTSLSKVPNPKNLLKTWKKSIKILFQGYDNSPMKENR